MNPFPTRLAATLATLILSLSLAPGLAMAGDGHDHGEAAPSANGPALPRFAAVSELFELVGVLNGKQITLYLDRAADNSPVSEAQIDLEIGDQKFTATRLGTDAFEVVLAEAPRAGVLPITATVSAGADVDLLAGELDVHEAAHDEPAAPAHAWKAYGGWAVGGVAALAILLTILLTSLLTKRRRALTARTARHGRAGGVA